MVSLKVRPGFKQNQRLQKKPESGVGENASNTHTKQRLQTKPEEVSNQTKKASTTPEKGFKQNQKASTQTSASKGFRVLGF